MLKSYPFLRSLKRINLRFTFDVLHFASQSSFVPNPLLDDLQPPLTNFMHDFESGSNLYPIIFILQYPVVGRPWQGWPGAFFAVNQMYNKLWVKNDAKILIQILRFYISITITFLAGFLTHLFRFESIHFWQCTSYRSKRFTLGSLVIECEAFESTSAQPLCDWTSFTRFQHRWKPFKTWKVYLI